MTTTLYRQPRHTEKNCEFDPGVSRRGAEPTLWETAAGAGGNGGWGPVTCQPATSAWIGPDAKYTMNSAAVRYMSGCTSRNLPRAVLSTT